MTTGSLVRLYADPNSSDYDFHARVGRTLTQWAHIESTLCMFFSRFGQIPPDMARRIFYSVEGFRPRSKLLLAAIDGQQSEMTDFLRSVVGKIRSYSGSRNLIAHGDAVTIRNPSSPYDGQMIIIQGRDRWQGNTPREEIITSDDLETTCANFALMSSVIAGVFNWGDPSQRPTLQEYRELAGLLPSEAHRIRLDQTTLERFAIVPDAIPVSR